MPVLRRAVTRLSLSARLKEDESLILSPASVAGIQSGRGVFGAVRVLPIALTRVKSEAPPRGVTRA